MPQAPVPEVDCPASLRVTGSIPMAHVADVDQSVRFYSLLGFSCASRFSGPDGVASWAKLKCGPVRHLIARASGPVEASEQAVLFYMYSEDVRGLREHLLQRGLPDAGTPPGLRVADDCASIPSGAAVFAVSTPFYMPEGELRIHDPDGYVILIGQADFSTI